MKPQTKNIIAVLLAGLWINANEFVRNQILLNGDWVRHYQAMGQVFRLGWPIGVTGLAESGLFQATALMMGWIGTVELAAHGIAMEITALSFMVHMGLSNAATVRVGRAEGEGDLQGMRDAGVTAVGLSAGFGVLMIVLFLIERFWLVGLFIDVGNPDAERIIAVGGTLMLMAALFQMFDAMHVALGLKPDDSHGNINGDEQPDTLVALKVLLVEDNPVNQEVAGTILRRFGCDVAIAEGGIDGVREELLSFQTSCWMF